MHVYRCSFIKHRETISNQKKILEEKREPNYVEGGDKNSRRHALQKQNLVPFLFYGFRTLQCKEVETFNDLDDCDRVDPVNRFPGQGKPDLSLSRYHQVAKQSFFAGISATLVLPAVYPCLAFYPYSVRQSILNPEAKIGTLLKSFFCGGRDLVYTGFKPLWKMIGTQYALKWGAFGVLNGFTGATDRTGKIVNPFTLMLNAFIAGMVDARMVVKPFAMQAYFFYQASDLRLSSNNKSGVVKDYASFKNHTLETLGTTTPIWVSKTARKYHHGIFTMFNIGLSMNIDQTFGLSKKYGEKGRFLAVFLGTLVGVLGSEFMDRMRVLAVVRAFSDKKAYSGPELLRLDILDDVKKKLIGEFFEDPFKVMGGLVKRVPHMCIAYIPFFVFSFLGIKAVSHQFDRTVETVQKFQDNV